MTNTLIQNNKNIYILYIYYIYKLYIYIYIGRQNKKQEI